jgi:dTDP-4-dehydrorhamnose reductase
MASKETTGVFDDKEHLKHHPILLIGGNGNVGTGILSGLKTDIPQECIKVASRHGEVKCDITDAESLKRTIESVRPSIIFHLAAATDVNGCERDPDTAWKLNFDGTKNLVKAAGHTPIVMFSTDFVFDGESDIPRREVDQPNPQSVYGMSKFAGECIMLDSGNPGFIARISYPWYKLSTHTRLQTIKDTPRWIYQSLVAGNNINVYKNVMGNWTSMDYLGTNILNLTQKMITNNYKIVHLGGYSYSVSQVAYALQKVVTRVSSTPGNITEVLAVPEEHRIAKRPEKGGMNCQLSRDMGYKQPDIIELIGSGRYFE